MKRVELASPTGSGTALVPERQVEGFVQRGWARVDKPAPAKKAPAKKAAAKSDDN